MTDKATIAELRAMVASDPQSKSFQVRTETLLALLDALEAERAKSKEYRALVLRIMGECEMNMSRARKLEMRAIEDGHDSERWHQDGKWHGNNDILDYAENGLAKLPTEGKRDE